MKTLVATGTLAEVTVKKAVGDLADVLVVDTEIAAFITPRKLLAAAEEQISYFDYDLVFVPGVITSNFTKVETALGAKVRLGPKHAYDLDLVLPFVKNMDFSTSVPACELLADVRKKVAHDKVNELEKRALSAFTLGNSKIGGNSRMKVMAEVVDATGIGPAKLAEIVKGFELKGADIIDLGASLHANPRDVRSAIEVARSVTDLPLSIDTLDHELIKEALDCGIDLVLSLDSSNICAVGPDIASAGVPAVIIPDSGKGLKSLSVNIDSAKNTGVKQIIADPVLDPIGHGITNSIMRYVDFHRQNPNIAIFFGAGNVTELIDADSAGVNATLCGIAADLGASILFTPEHSNKTRGSVSELKKAALMMALAKERNSSPKDLGIDLLGVKEKRRRSDATMPEASIRAKKRIMWTTDPKGSIRISIIPDDTGKGGFILAEHEKTSIVGRHAGEVMDTILDMKLVSRMEHAGYLGQELKKADIALELGRSYSQDDYF